MSTKWTGGALTGLIANARVAPALFVAHVYLSFIGQPKVVAANASPLTALALAGLETCYVPVDNIRSIPICRSRVMRLALRPCRRWRAALVQIRPPARNNFANAVPPGLSCAMSLGHSAYAIRPPAMQGILRIVYQATRNDEKDARCTWHTT